MPDMRLRGNRYDPTRPWPLLPSAGPGALRRAERDSRTHRLLLYCGGRAPKLLGNLPGRCSGLRERLECLQLARAPACAVVGWTSCHGCYSKYRQGVGWIGDHTPLSTPARALLTVCNMLERGRAPGSACCFGAYLRSQLVTSRAPAARVGARPCGMRPRRLNISPETANTAAAREFCAARAGRVPSVAGVRRAQVQLRRDRVPAGSAGRG